VRLLLAAFHLVEGRLRDIDMPAFNQLGYLPVEEGKQQRAYMTSVDVGVRHDDDAVISKLRNVEVVFADSATERGYQRAYLCRGEHLVEARLLHVQDLALQRQDGLSSAIPPLFGGSTGRVTLDDENL